MMTLTDNDYNTITVVDKAGESLSLGEFFGDHSKHGSVEFSEDGDRADVIIVEELDWHQKHNPERMEELTDEEGWLTEGTRETIARSLAKIVGGEAEIELSETDAYPDTPSVAFVASYHVSPETTLGTLHEMSYRFYAEVINVTDPGTFNSPYVFGTMVDPSYS